MEIKDSVVFQVDSAIVKDVYNTCDNYLIQYNENAEERDLCVIYFSSNNIYYPNTEEVFRKRIIDKNFFEWYNIRIQKAYKHIFIRDIFKQWYLKGINSKINTIEKLLSFLRIETDNYRIITLGSSAGGYAAVLFGSLLDKVQYVLNFNGQYEVKSLLNKSSELINPLLFRLKDDETYYKYYDICSCLNDKISIYYFNSLKSDWDNSQKNQVLNRKNIVFLNFKTSHHGIPFLKCALPKILNINKIEQLNKLAERNWNPVFFSIKLAGIRKTILEIYQLYIKRRLFIK